MPEKTVVVSFKNTHSSVISAIFGVLSGVLVHRRFPENHVTRYDPNATWLITDHAFTKYQGSGFPKNALKKDQMHLVVIIIKKTQAPRRYRLLYMVLGPQYIYINL